MLEKCNLCQESVLKKSIYGKNPFAVWRTKRCERSIRQAYRRIKFATFAFVNLLSMIEIFVLIAMSRWHYSLAKTYNKPNKWIYPLLAVVAYFGVGVLSVMILMLATAAMGSTFFDTMNSSILGLFMIPFGVAGVWLLHVILKNAWSKQKSQQMENEALLDADASDDDLL